MSLSSQFRGTGAPDVPLKSPSVRSLPAKCLIVSCYHDKTSPSSRVFIGLFSFCISGCVFFRLFISKMAVSAFLRNRLLKIEILKTKNSRIF